MRVIFYKRLGCRTLPYLFDALSPGRLDQGGYIGLDIWCEDLQGFVRQVIGTQVKVKLLIL